MIVAAFTFFFPHSRFGLGSSASNHKALRSLHIGICKRPCASAIINNCVWALETATLMTWGLAGKPVHGPALTIFNITTGNSLPCACVIDNGVGASLNMEVAQSPIRLHGPRIRTMLEHFEDNRLF